MRSAFSAPVPCLALVGCATTDPSIDREATVEFEHIAKPTEHVSERAVLYMGNETYKFVSVEGDLVILKSTRGELDGCTVTYDGWFAPLQAIRTAVGSDPASKSSLYQASGQEQGSGRSTVHFEPLSNGWSWRATLGSQEP